MKDLVLHGDCDVGVELDKRFYIPGAKIVGKCGECEVEVEKNFGNDYLSYPETNKPKDVYLYCRECGTELGPVRVIVRIKLELAQEGA